MGTAHVLLHKLFIEKLYNYSDQIKIVQMVLFDDNLYNVLIESSVLPDGYNGQQEISIKQDKIYFKREADV